MRTGRKMSPIENEGVDEIVCDSEGGNQCVCVTERENVCRTSLDVLRRQQDATANKEAVFSLHHTRQDTKQKHRGIPREMFTGWVVLRYHPAPLLPAGCSKGGGGWGVWGVPVFFHWCVCTA